MPRLFYLAGPALHQQAKPSQDTLTRCRSTELQDMHVEHARILLRLLLAQPADLVSCVR